jgi:exodeoxyribonuclease V
MDTSKLELSLDQSNALKNLLGWFNDKNKSAFITLGGYAGTGKTTLIAKLRTELKKSNPDLKISFCTYTGKASRVLNDKLKNFEAIFAEDSLSTIHSLIYSPKVDDNENIIGWGRKEKLQNDLIIVDEGSMVDANIWSDLRSYEKPILVVGDHGQLSPINGTFNLMEKPHLKLQEIHRQEKDNPIIKLSIMARESGFIPPGKYSDLITKISRTDEEAKFFMEDVMSNYREDTLYLCGFNNTRVKLNNYMRSVLQIFEPEPQTNDKVVCLRNNHQERIFNGMLGKIEFIEETADEDWLFASINLEGSQNYKGLIYKKQFNNIASLNYTDNRSNTMKGDLFDFGYALTVHKAQGSEAKRVVLFEERFPKMDEDAWRKWLYTAVTRAKEELYIIGK